MDQKSVDYLFRFFGYGDPSSRLWFIGIEEGGAEGAAPVTQGHIPFEVDGMRFHRDGEVQTDNKNGVWRTYKQIAQESGLGLNYFMSNIAPLARKSVSTELTTVGAKDYAVRVRTERVANLKRLVEHFAPAVVVFHGKTAWRDYGVQEAFGLQRIPALPGAPRVLAYPDAGIMLTNFFTTRYGSFSTSDREHVIRYTRQWL